MKTYHGERAPEGCAVWVDDKPLPLRLEIRNHSPSGFEWGYSGSGPAQLALALLLDHTNNDIDRVMPLYQEFKRKVVSRFASDEWRLTSAEIDACLKEMAS